MNEYVKQAQETGLISELLEWLQNREYVTVGSIQRDFYIGFTKAKAIFDYLIEEGLLESNLTKHGNKVINK